MKTVLFIYFFVALWSLVCIIGEQIQKWLPVYLRYRRWKKRRASWGMIRRGCAK